MDCNWKLALHNFLEGYHTNTVHPNTLAPFLLPRSFTVSLLAQGHARIAVRKSKQASIYSTDDSCSDSVSDVFKQYAISIGCRSEEQTSELQSLMRISSAVFCLKKKKTQIKIQLSN